MTNYDKLVAALRYHADTTNCDACKLYDAGKCELKSCVLHDAADAIEALQAEIRESMQRCAECGDELAHQMPKRGEIVRCGECKWWRKKDDSPYGYCYACKHGHYSEHWEIGIYRLYKADWFCADGEREVQDESAGSL